MIRVRIIQYWNDNHKNELEERFRDLEELADWMFSRMRVDYTSEYGRNLLSFPKCDVDERIYSISVRPDYGSYVFWIKQIEDEHSGIIFSDGTFTAGQKHCTKAVREWLARCEKRKKNPTFNFAPDEADTDSKEDFISGNLVKRAAKKIHEAGGCDAKDEYSKGYDDAITVALNILLEETGFTIEDVLDYKEDEENQTMTEYNPEFWKRAENITVGQFCDYVSKHILPDAVLHVCGEEQLYLHLSTDGNIFSLDDNALSDLLEYEDCKVGEFGTGETL